MKILLLGLAAAAFLVRAPNVLFGGGLTFLLFLVTTVWLVLVIRKKPEPELSG